MTESDTLMNDDIAYRALLPLHCLPRLVYHLRADWRRVQDHQPRLLGNLDKVERQPYGVEVEDRWTTRNEDEASDAGCEDSGVVGVGGCVDDDDLIAVPFGRRQRAVQPRWMLALHVHIDYG